jgi:glutamine synthetase adenylyltransferase
MTSHQSPVTPPATRMLNAQTALRLAAQDLCRAATEAVRTDDFTVYSEAESRLDAACAELLSATCKLSDERRLQCASPAP